MQSALTGQEAALAKVPAITLGFWIIKILATTLGETAGDAVSMSWLGETTEAATGWGYLIGTGIFIVPLLLLVAAQIRARGFNRWLYWATIIASTTAGTTMADFATRSLGIGYPGGSALLFALVLAALFAWHSAAGSIAVESVTNPRSEAFYWLTITISQTLGTALGDWTADTGGLGYLGGATLFALGLFALLLLWRFSAISRTLLFWSAFILTRPLGATVGDLLDKPFEKGGFEVSRAGVSLLLVGVIALLVWLLPQRAANRAH